MKASGDQAKVLVVDSEPLQAMLLQEMLETAGAKVETASGAQAALEKAAAFKPDLITLPGRFDVGDPLDLLAVLKKRESTRPVPVFLVTGNSRPAFLAAVQAAGVERVLQRPFKMPDLHAAVRRALAVPRVLVVDDDEEVLALCEEALTRRGLRVFAAVSAQQARGRLQARRFDLVMTDHVDLPRDQFGMLTEVKRTWPSTGVVVMTASPDDDEPALAAAAGALRHWRKPLLAAQFEAAADLAKTSKLA